MQDRGCLCGIAYPVFPHEQPGIDETPAPQIGLPPFDAFSPISPNHDRGIADYLHIHRFRGDLLQVRGI